MTELYRTQILLERRQHENLKQLAAAEGRSMSEIIREAVAEYLVEKDEAVEKQQWQEALEELSRIREAIRTEWGEIPVDDLLAEIREERADELWRVLQGE